MFAEQVATGDVRDMEVLGDTRRLRALAGTGRADQQ
jgi:hypothetical protein